MIYAFVLVKNGMYYRGNVSGTSYGWTSDKRNASIFYDGYIAAVLEGITGAKAERYE